MDNQSGLSNIQQQLATGKKLLRPSDDPVGATKVVRLTEELAQLKQYQRNNDLLRNSLEEQEAVLRNINNAVSRARTLAIQAGNGVYSDEDRRAISIEVAQIRDEVFDLMNAQNANGEYIFAGFQSNSQAFAFNPSASGKKYTFDGDTGNNEIQVSNTVSLGATTSGFEIFENVLARLDAPITASTGVTSASVKVTQQDKFDQFHNNNYDAITAANNQFRATILAGNQVQITNVASGAVLATQDFQSGQPFSFNGLSFTIEGAVGNTVDFTLSTPEKKNVAETLNDLVNVLTNNFPGQQNFDDGLADALVGMDNALVAIQNETSSIGGRLNVAESIYEANLDIEIANKKSLSTIQDVDYAEASAEFSKQETALNAALATFPQISNLSLFNYI